MFLCVGVFGVLISASRIEGKGLEKSNEQGRTPFGSPCARSLRDGVVRDCLARQGLLKFEGKH